MLKILAIHGKMGSGKTTLLEEVAKNLPGAITVEFAAPLKALVHSMTGNAEKEHYCPIYKKTNAQLYQEIGAYLRQWHSEAWALSYYHRCKWYDSQGDYIILTPDVRYPNEVRCVESLGGVVLKIPKRDGRDDGRSKDHESETALDGMNLPTIKVPDKDSPEFGSYCGFLAEKLLNGELLKGVEAIKRFA
jgi:hypothetical protein